MSAISITENVILKGKVIMLSVLPVVILAIVACIVYYKMVEDKMAEEVGKRYPSFEVQGRQ